MNIPIDPTSPQADRRYTPAEAKAPMALSHVGIDGLNLAIPRGTGVATYARSLSYCIKELGCGVDVIYGLNIAAKTDPTLREVQFFDLLESERGRKPPKFPSVGWALDRLRASAGFQATEIPITGRMIVTPLKHRLPQYDRILNVQDLFAVAGRYFRDFRRFISIKIDNPPEIMHWTYPVPIRLLGSKNIYTIHDLVPLRMPYTTLDNKTVHMRLLNACIQNADHIVTVSETSRRDILEFFPNLSPKRITNTYQAITSPLHRLGDAEIKKIVSGAFDLQPRGYFLFFGSIEPKKNVGRLLEAYLASDIEMPLVIVGARAWKSEGELVLLQHRPMNDRRIRQIDYVPADVLVTLICGARAVVFPSLYEGFGLPVLEAMSLGTPVLTSREGSLPEIAGDAALMVDPYDSRDIAAGMQRLAQNDELCIELAERGLARASLFNMAHYRNRIMALYQSVLGEAS
jgi:glycosyltransferase involved in cell wall biosynthesis